MNEKHPWSGPLVLPTVCTDCGIEYFEVPLSAQPCPGVAPHTCVNTGTTIDGRPLPPCRACVAMRAREGNPSIAPEPIPMILHCPECRARHVDEGAFATKAHHTHSCQSCGFTWRPAVIPTVGVQFLPGFKNEPTAGG